jgi:streptomycin 6-kinase
MAGVSDAVLRAALEPAYDLSNAFRNPNGDVTVPAEPARTERRADAFSTRLGYDRKRLLGWAAAHSALTISWDLPAGNAIDWDLTVLPNLVRAYEQA